MKKIGVLLIVCFITSGMTCLPETIAVKNEKTGDLLAGRECVGQPDGSQCCTSKVPVNGIVVEVSKCYAPDGEEIPVE